MAFWKVTNHMLRWVIVTYKLTAVFILYSTKFMICYWSKRCMLRRSLWFVTGQVTNHKLGRNIQCSDQQQIINLVVTYSVLTLVKALCYDQVDNLLPGKALYATTKFMICYWSERCMLQSNTIWTQQLIYM
jgi:hypothetical protein